MIGLRTPWFHATQEDINFILPTCAKMLQAQMRVSKRLDRGLIKEIKVTKRKINEHSV